MAIATQKIRTFLWFDTQAEEAARFYTSIFRNGKIGNILRNGPGGPGAAGSVLVVDFELDGVQFIALNGGPHFKFTEAISLSVDCEDQAEVDHLWAHLTADGGAAGDCSWVKDKYGLSWQIVPRRLPQLLQDPDPARARRAMAAMMTMQKIDVAALERAVAGD
jgi:predicted 3-demethylubiquinone-9 3-methyltransferase (glyoxalase superfamily)